MSWWRGLVASRSGGSGTAIQRGADVGGVVVAVGGRGGGMLSTSSCGHAATSSAVLYRISYDVGVVPRLSSSTVWTVYEMACFLCFPLL